VHPHRPFHRSREIPDRSHRYPELVHRGPVQVDPSLRTAGEIVEARTKGLMPGADPVLVRQRSTNEGDRHAA